jgi:uncharacterized protein YqgC (DUF456 family)
MKEAAVATAGFMGLVWFGLMVAGLIFIAQVEAEEPDDDPYSQVVRNATWSVGLFVTSLYVANAIGLGREEPWGRALSYLLFPVTLLTGIGLILGPLGLVFVAKTPPR